jgi:hypothetical protein
MKSSIGARLLLIVGFLAASCAYSGWTATRTAFDPGATRSASQALLTTKTVQKSLGDQLSEQVGKELRRAKTDPRITAATTQALRDPRVVNAFATAVADVHQALLSNSGGKIALDTRAVTDAVHDALAARDPKLAKQFSPQKPLAVELDTKQLPRLGRAREIARTAAWAGALIALVLVGASLLLAHERRDVARVGRRIAYLSICPLLFFGLLPHFLEGADGDAPEVGGALLRTYGSRVMPSAIALLVVGITVVVGSLAIRRRTAEAPRPAPMQPPPAPGPPDPRLAHPPVAAEEMYL